MDLDTHVETSHLYINKYREGFGYPARGLRVAMHLLRASMGYAEPWAITGKT
jgi:hypothetical protein